MDWITGIQKAIDYTEEQLEEKIDFEKVAEEACSSSFQFQRIFTALCGISLGKYIRNRRLSRAAEILANSDAKVIDVAFRFCYETPESFTRAFTRFHRITPMEAKRGGRVKSFSKLSVKLVLTGAVLWITELKNWTHLRFYVNAQMLRSPWGWKMTP